MMPNENFAEKTGLIELTFVDKNKNDLKFILFQTKSISTWSLIVSTSQPKKFRHLGKSQNVILRNILVGQKNKSFNIFLSIFPYFIIHITFQKFTAIIVFWVADTCVTCIQMEFKILCLEKGMTYQNYSLKWT